MSPILRDEGIISPTMFLDYFFKKDSIPLQRVLLSFFSYIDQTLLTECFYKKIKIFGRTAFYNESTETLIFPEYFQGSSMASLYLEILIAMGAKEVISIGTAGALVNSWEIGQLLYTPCAIAGEGVSSYYRLQAKELTVQLVPTTRLPLLAPSSVTWTTDALFRESLERIEDVKILGAEVVEMEIAALISVALFRKIEYTPYVIISDQLCSENWKPAFRDVRIKNMYHQFIKELLLTYYIS